MMPEGVTICEAELGQCDGKVEKMRKERRKDEGLRMKKK
jgi:hypothetical protein